MQCEGLDASITRSLTFECDEFPTAVDEKSRSERISANNNLSCV
jgi:hypothetical protein